LQLKNVENGVTTDSTSEHSAGYNSIFMQIRDVNRESESELEFLVKSLRVLQNTRMYDFATTSLMNCKISI